MPNENEDFIIHAIPVLKDNIIWVWQIGKQVVVVDPAISKPVIQWIKDNNYKLHAILQTHHHDDHIGGTPDLIKHWPFASVIASKKDINRIPFQSYSVSDQENISLMGYQIKVIEVPGHTSNHLAYYLSDDKNKRKVPALFIGDTLFGGGCGRIFEGTYQEMFNSLQRVNKLPSQTKIYCAHEYTEANLRWAHKLFPNDLDIKKRLKDVSKKRANGFLSIPSKLAEERKTNLFLRAQSVNEFQALRNHKNNWNG